MNSYLCLIFGCFDVHQSFSQLVNPDCFVIELLMQQIFVRY